MEEPQPTSGKRWDLVHYAGRYGIGFWDRDFEKFTPVMIFHDIYSVRRLLKQLELKLALIEKEEEQTATSEVEQYLKIQKPPSEDVET